ncbi:ATP-grasp domain-containing protein [Desulfovibrio desulfuricans]|uniref:ATP-grasp domain-containing protein n=1 Tax=Desulfovibrio desulfuricans TaxID=876 RepID=UPI0035B3AD17
MIIFDEPYVSPELQEYAAARREPVLDNAVARDLSRARALSGAAPLNLVAEADFASLCRADAAGGTPPRIYTCSENSLAWVSAHVDNPQLVGSIEKLKNKALTRELLRPLYDDYFYRKLSLDALRHLPFEELRLPCVVKPAVGFFSLGVRIVRDRADWLAALAAIEQEAVHWREQYPDSVVDSEDWLIEEYIDGDEFAVDVYFDEQGQAVICNVLRHEFASASDVSDRLYYTGASVVRAHLAEFEDWFNRVNALLGLRNFPAHVELRRDAHGRIRPIEFNALRFAGWCCTDVTLFAWGFHTYGCFLEGRRPDWDQALAGREGKLYTLIVLNKPENCPPVRSFDYDALSQGFGRVLHVRKSDFTRYGLFGFLFTETPENARQELDRIASSDLLEFTR